MRKAMVYILALTLAFSTLLAGCGENTKDRDGTKETQKPQTSAAPETMMPDPEDGVVKDDDGIITDGDTGSVTDDNVLNNDGSREGVIGGMDNGITGNGMGNGTGNGTANGATGGMTGSGSAAMP